MRWIRILKWPVFVGIIIGLLVSNIIALKKLTTISNEHKTQADTIAVKDKEQEDTDRERNKKILARLDCISEFLSKPNRDQLTIASIEECVIQKEASQTTPQLSQKQLQRQQEQPASTQP